MSASPLLVASSWSARGSSVQVANRSDRPGSDYLAGAKRFGAQWEEARSGSKRLKASEGAHRIGDGARECEFVCSLASSLSPSLAFASGGQVITSDAASLCRSVDAAVLPCSPLLSVPGSVRLRSVAVITCVILPQADATAATLPPLKLGDAMLSSLTHVPELQKALPSLASVNPQSFSGEWISMCWWWRGGSMVQGSSRCCWCSHKACGDPDACRSFHGRSSSHPTG